MIDLKCKKNPHGGEGGCRNGIGSWGYAREAAKKVPAEGKSE